ncbi:MAG: hypothetical protein IPP83_13180 [Flavobacteriales bacterium]|nr:hypothetical protein [Flavobacteriales bacterium]
MIMQRAAVKVAGGILALGLLSPGCIKRDSFPAEPAIKYKSFAVFGDSASLTISFTDGDGDVGLDASDNTSPFNTGSPYYYNLFVDYDDLQNDIWVPIVFAVPLKYRIPRITPTGQNKALEGEIAVALRPWPLIPQPTGTVDTIRLSVRMYDRALHESNSTVSPTFLITH